MVLQNGDFEFLKDICERSQCALLAAGVCKMLFASPDSSQLNRPEPGSYLQMFPNLTNKGWKASDYVGVICLCYSRVTFGLNFQLICPRRKDVTFYYEVYFNMRYEKLSNTLHSFEIDDCVIGFNFASFQEANLFFDNVSRHLKIFNAQSTLRVSEGIPQMKSEGSVKTKKTLRSVGKTKKELKAVAKRREREKRQKKKDEKKRKKEMKKLKKQQSKEKLKNNSLNTDLTAPTIPATLSKNTRFRTETFGSGSTAPTAVNNLSMRTEKENKSASFKREIIPDVILPTTQLEHQLSKGKKKNTKTVRSATQKKGKTVNNSFKRGNGRTLRGDPVSESASATTSSNSFKKAQKSNARVRQKLEQEDVFIPKLKNLSNDSLPPPPPDPSTVPVFSLPPKILPRRKPALSVNLDGTLDTSALSTDMKRFFKQAGVRKKDFRNPALSMAILRDLQAEEMFLEYKAKEEYKDVDESNLRRAVDGNLKSYNNYIGKMDNFRQLEEEQKKQKKGSSQFSRLKAKTISPPRVPTRIKRRGGDRGDVSNSDFSVLSKSEDLLELEPPPPTPLRRMKKSEARSRVTRFQEIKPPNERLSLLENIPPPPPKVKKEKKRPLEKVETSQSRLDALFSHLEDFKEPELPKLDLSARVKKNRNPRQAFLEDIAGKRWNVTVAQGNLNFTMQRLKKKTNSFNVNGDVGKGLLRTLKERMRQHREMIQGEEEDSDNDSDWTLD